MSQINNNVPQRPNDFPKIPEDVRRNPESFTKWLGDLTVDNRYSEGVKRYATYRLDKLLAKIKREVYRADQEIAQKEAGEAEKQIKKYDKLIALQGGAKQVVLLSSPLSIILGIAGCSNAGGGSPLPPPSSYLETNLNQVPEEAEWEGNSANIPVSVSTVNKFEENLVIDKINIPGFEPLITNDVLKPNEEKIFSLNCVKEKDPSDCKIKAEVFHHLQRHPVEEENIHCNVTDEKTVKILAVKPEVRVIRVDSYPNNPVAPYKEVYIGIGAENKHKKEVYIKKIIYDNGYNYFERDVNVHLNPDQNQEDVLLFSERVHNINDNSINAKVKVIYDKIAPAGYSKECTVEIEESLNINKEN